MTFLSLLIIVLLYIISEFFNKSKKVLNFYFFSVFYIASFSIYSQTLFGTVKDSLNNPLQNVNIIAESKENKDIKFAITDYLGRYKLLLDRKKNDKINVSYLGYKTQEYHTGLNSIKKEHHFILKQKEEILNEIVIDYKPKPILVKKDTLTYLVDFFKDGKEFKMIEILEKLPGFEVSENGSVTVQGKDVSKVLVENKPFFGGSTKLAIENIPADALEKIEVIDHFNEVDFLKQVSDSKEMVINVKLKKDKKEFVFGDIEAGTEIADNINFYLLHASLFSYNKKTNLSFIGNLNNIGKRSFSFDDLMRFQNIKSNYTRKKRNFNNLSNIGKSNSDILKSKSQFSALNLSFEVNNKMRVASYGIFSKLSTNSLLESNVRYFQNDLSLLEKKRYEKNITESLALGNLEINYSPNANSKLIHNTQFQFVKPKTNNIITNNIR